jgi:hypothetical protein
MPMTRQARTWQAPRSIRTWKRWYCPFSPLRRIPQQVCELAFGMTASEMAGLLSMQYNNVLNEQEKEHWAAHPPRSLMLKAGHAAFHHALTVHGSWGNLSQAPRRALVLNFFADGVMSLMDGSLMKGLPRVARGEVLGGRFHPIVFDAAHHAAVIGRVPLSPV